MAERPVQSLEQEIVATVAERSRGLDKAAEKVLQN
jgi:hypothetical protein